MLEFFIIFLFIFFVFCISELYQILGFRSTRKRQKIIIFSPDDGILRSMIIINFKDYDESTGENAVSLAKEFEKVFNETGVPIVVVVHPFDLRNVVEACPNLAVYCQTADGYTLDESHTKKKTQTGRITPIMLKKTGATGVILNHAENPLVDDEIERIVNDMNADFPEAQIVVCAGSSERAEAVSKRVEVAYIAIEPPDLIGGDISVTTRPEIIEEAVEKVGDNVLVGAGVKTAEDITKAKELGAKGVLLASGVIKPKDGGTPYESLIALTKAF